MARKSENGTKAVPVFQRSVVTIKVDASAVNKATREVVTLNDCDIPDGVKDEYYLAYLSRHYNTSDIRIFDYENVRKEEWLVTMSREEFLAKGTWTKKA